MKREPKVAHGEVYTYAGLARKYADPAYGIDFSKPFENQGMCGRQNIANVGHFITWTGSLAQLFQKLKRAYRIPEVPVVEAAEELAFTRMPLGTTYHDPSADPAEGPVEAAFVFCDELYQAAAQDEKNLYWFSYDANRLKLHCVTERKPEFEVSMNFNGNAMVFIAHSQLTALALSKRFYQRDFAKLGSQLTCIFDEDI